MIILFRHFIEHIICFIFKFRCLKIMFKPMKVDSVGKELTHPQGCGFNSCCKRNDLFGGWSISTSVNAHRTLRPSLTLVNPRAELMYTFFLSQKKKIMFKFTLIKSEHAVLGFYFLFWIMRRLMFFLRIYYIKLYDSLSFIPVILEHY